MSKRKPLLLLTGTVTALFLMACGCGGIWDEAMGQALGEQCAEMKGKIEMTKSGRNRTKASKLMDECYVDAQGGKLELMPVAMLAANVDQMVADGEIDDAELEALENEYEGIVN